MNVIGTVLTFLVGIEHIGICFLEIFGNFYGKSRHLQRDARPIIDIGLLRF